MSGGVDSSLTARLLVERDYDLSAVFMRNWDTRDESGTDSGCEWKKDWEDVQNVCNLLRIPCEMIDLSREYWTRVFEPSLHYWESGQTPNPDVWCNRSVKFGALVDRLPPNTQWVATGHYARKSWIIPSSSSSLPFPPPRPQLLRAVDSNKDQSYYLSSIPETSLSKTLFPLGDFTKPQVREMAKKFGLPTAEREESMGICFVGEKRKFRDFLSQYITPKPGRIVDLTSGKTVGIHQGLWDFTIGQGAKIPGLPERAFVAKKNPVENIVYIVPGSDHPALYSSKIKVKDFTWIWADTPPEGFFGPDGVHIGVKYRYRSDIVGATIRRENPTNAVVAFDRPQKAIAPGQIAAVYASDWCLGCGVIVEAS
ncbi:hypothetical protein JAAARDRAFT_125188 [Jaapia argillacea MUCL 33604]|uniref:tRNA-5-taurinomethyluridine 2-sulfurtransferase n=1 Tax=Jaapia argillacea MUCL 33604 TaxID=933084 RepID=A0A067Q2D6_9AGAM|nr:hypothetical protein JAAARDRAFT_125188 [Jaapia argillacea MUCL 33604]